MFKKIIQLVLNKVKSETPKAIETQLMRTMPKDNSSVSARDLLKEATTLKKEKKFDEACTKLEEAYSAKDAGDLTLKEKLRLPMYLQLAGKNDEGWRIINELLMKHIDVFSQAEIANQMRVFLQKENKFKHAILFSVWAICKEIERDRYNIKSCIDLADEMAKLDAEFKSLTKIDFNKHDKSEIVGTTSKGNRITDKSYIMFKERIEDSMSIDGIINRLASDLKKADLENKASDLAKSISSYLHTKKLYDLAEVRDLISKISD